MPEDLLELATNFQKIAGAYFVDACFSDIVWHNFFLDRNGPIRLNSYTTSLEISPDMIKIREFLWA